VELERGFSEEVFSEAEESNGNLKQPMVHAVFSKISSLEGSFPTVRAPAVGQDVERDAVLAGDLKGLVYYVIRLNKDTPSRGFEEERIRIHLQAWANIQNRRYRE